MGFDPSLIFNLELKSTVSQKKIIIEFSAQQLFHVCLFMIKVHDFHNIEKNKH